MELNSSCCAFGHGQTSDESVVGHRNSSETRHTTPELEADEPHPTPQEALEFLWSSRVESTRVTGLPRCHKKKTGLAVQLHLHESREKRQGWKETERERVRAKLERAKNSDVTSMQHSCNMTCERILHYCLFLVQYNHLSSQFFLGQGSLSCTGKGRAEKNVISQAAGGTAREDSTT